MLYRILVFLAALICATAWAETPREVMAKAIMIEDSEQQAKLVQSLADSGSPEVEKLLTLWKEGGIFLLDGPKETKIAVTLGHEKDAEEKQAAFRFDTGAPVLDAAGKPLRALASDSEHRRDGLTSSHGDEERDGSCATLRDRCEAAPAFRRDARHGAESRAPSRAAHAPGKGN